MKTCIDCKFFEMSRQSTSFKIQCTLSYWNMKPNSPTSMSLGGVYVEEEFRRKIAQGDSCRAFEEQGRLV